MFGEGARHDAAWAGELLRCFDARRTRRETVREDEHVEDHDWFRLEDGHLMLRVREGSLLAYLDNHRRGQWSLYVQWDGHGGAQFLASGSRNVIERLARRIQQLGPPGGPTFVSPGPRWRHYDDETEHAVTVGGGLRLMPPAMDDDVGVLVLAHNDANGSVSVLGVGEHDELQDGADELGATVRARVRLSIGGRVRYLQALGADGIVGYLELGDDLFVLGHLGGDEFGLASQSGGIRRAIRTYSLEEVMGGDLGSVEAWARSPSSGGSPPRRAVNRRATRGRPAARVAAQRIERPAPTPARLSGRDLIDALRHLTPENDWTGEASSVVPKLLNAIRALVQLPDLGNKIFWAKGLLRFIAEETGLEIHCCTKILNLALRRIAARTKLIVRRGRRWELLFGDLRTPGSKVLRWAAERGPLDRSLKPRPPRPAKNDRKGHPPQAPPATASDTTTEPTPAVEPGAPAPDTPSSQPATTSSPPADMAPSLRPVDVAQAVSNTARPTAETPRSASPPAEDSTPTAAPPTPRDAADRAHLFAYMACDPSDGRSTASIDTATTVLATGAPIGTMTAPPSAHRHQPRPRLDPGMSAAMGFPASMSYEHLTKLWVAELGRATQFVGHLPGNDAATYRHDARPGMRPWADDDSNGPELRSPGGWLRRDSDKRQHRPP